MTRDGDRKIAYKGKFVNIRHDIVNVKGRSVTREVVVSRQGVLIAAINESNQIVLVKQYRHNLGNVCEVPSGAINDSELPLAAAKRELLEETGLKAGEWRLLSTHHNGVHNEGLNYFFLAQDLSEEDRVLDEDEEISRFDYYSFNQVEELMDKQLIPDLRSRACIWKAQIDLGEVSGKLA